MKKKLLIALLIMITGLPGILNAQDKARVKNEKSITWYGIDFTLARFTSVTEDPAVIVSQYLKAINDLILAEPEKYNLKTFFSKTEVTPSVDQVNEKNAKIDPGTLVITDKYEVSLDDVKKVIKNYNTEGKTGMGLVFMAENLNKASQTGSYYVCFFDLATRDVIDARRMSAKAAGFGFRNYWAGSAYNVMKVWSK
jgi:hypothetical protein